MTEKEARFFDKFDLACYLSRSKTQGGFKPPNQLKDFLEPGEGVTKYLSALNHVLFEYYGELDEEKFMDVEALFSRVWSHYITECIEWSTSRLIESVQQGKAADSSLSIRPNRNIIAVVDYPAKQDGAEFDINVVMFALVRREPTCPMIGTKAEVHFPRRYADEEKFILPQERVASSGVYHSPEDAEKIWQDCVDHMYSALLYDAEPYMLGKKAGGLTISIHDDNENTMIVEAFRIAKDRFTRPEYRNKIRIVQEPI